ncbi:AEC family transporter [Photobacterium frigidiphilum]|uniref:AEC family transporter n=1 Tax=Photobacterium frigidiphilum TaxID=264736 RepID=UPI003D12FCBA
MNEFWIQLQYSFSVTGPIFIMLGLGIALRRWGIIEEKFIETGSKLVFTVTLPALLFLSVVKADLAQVGNINLLLFALAANTATFIIFECLAHWLVKDKAERGVVVQGAFRANTGIIGLAYVSNAYGENGLVVGSLYVAVITVLYNILAVITLTRSSPGNQSLNISYLLRSIVKNPLIIGICAAVPFSYLNISIPEVLLKSGSYFADMTLPLALLCTGASLDLKQLRQDSTHAKYSTYGRLIIAPGLISLAGYILGFRGLELGVIFLMSAAPTAAASYVMARSMGANAKLAANIIALTTVGSLLSCSLGITILNSFNL